MEERVDETNHKYQPIPPNEMPNFTYEQQMSDKIADNQKTRG